MEAGENLIEVQRDNIKNSERDFDTAVYTAARIFNAMALPYDMPDFLKEAIDARAEQAKISAQEAGFIAADMGRAFDGKTMQERERDKDEENRLYVVSVVQEIEQRLEREREEWAQQKHSFAGVNMSGEEYGAIGADLKRDSALRQWLIERLMKDGKTRSEAENKADVIADATTIMAKPESQRTDEEREKVKRAEQDPEIRKIMPKLAEQHRQMNSGMDQNQSLNSGQKISVETGSDLFASAPALSDHYGVALAATQPLQPAQKITRPTPTTPAPSGMAGVEI
ncbi:hypothetical protein WG908_16220 [Sphingobium sp. AN641]|uniref:hypothetical protein n=1 Tax=Sphingobium sp. AN641 TaxID=3133443 RepID=UPI0030BAB615